MNRRWVRLPPPGIPSVVFYAMAFMPAGSAIFVGLGFARADVMIVVRVMVLAFLAALLGVLWRLIRIGLYVRGDELRAQNPLRSHLLLREEVERFQLDVVDVWISPYPVTVPTAYLRDGRMVRFWGSGIWTFPQLRWQMERLDRLMNRLEEWIHRV